MLHLKTNNMNKLIQIFEFVYLVISMVLFTDYFLEFSGNDTNLVLIFAFISFGIFLFRRYYRIKFNNRKK
jgi:hypothetical protein